MTLGLSAIELFDKFSAAAEGRLSLVEAVGVADGLAVTDPALSVAFYAAWLVRAPEPMSAVGWYNAGALLEDLGAEERARAAFDKAARIAPASPLFAFSLLRLLMLDRKPKNDQALALCRRILGGGLHRRRHERAEIERMNPIVYFGTVAFYAALQEAAEQINRAEFFYETYFAQGGSNDTLVEKLAELTAARRARRKWSGHAEARLDRVDLDIVGGRRPSDRMIDPAALYRHVSHIDVDVISVLRLGREGEPLLHPALLAVLSTLEHCRQGPVRIDRVEVWTDGCGLDMVQLEEAVRSGCFEAMVVRCGGGADRREQLRFLETVATFRRLYDLDMALTARISDDGEADRARWIAQVQPLGWAVEFAAPGAPDPVAALVIGVDGVAAGLGDLYDSRYTRLLAGARG